MQKPLKEMIFKPVEGTWVNVADDSATLADVLSALSLQIDDKCEFARFKDYENKLYIWYRASAMRVTITIYLLQ